MKNSKFKNLIAVFILVAVAAAFAVVCTACAGDAPPPVAITVTFMDGSRTISSVTGKAGDPLAPPTAEQIEKAGYSFDGWLDADGKAVDLPQKFPDTDARFYAKYTADGEQTEDTYKIIYNGNLGSISKDDELAPSVGKTGETVKLKDGKDYLMVGYRFLGWTKTPIYVYDENDPFDPYLADEDFVIGDSDVTLYAQWATAYRDAAGKSADVIYVFEPLIDHGLGGAIYASAGKPDKLGFVASGDKTESGYKEFEFYYEDGNFVGRLLDNRTYATPGEEAGQYLYRDYVAGDGPDSVGGGYLMLDGYGLAVYIEQLGDQIAMRASGRYEYDEKYDDYLYEYIYEDGSVGETHFALTDGAPSDTEFDGLFLFQGYESGAYLLYGNGELYDTVLMLNGYGYATVYFYDMATEELTLISSGKYLGSAQYEDYQGEWEFVETDGDYGSFKFIVSTVNSGNDVIAIFVEYDESFAGTLNATSGDGVLYLDGYGGARYTASGIDYTGECVISESGNLLTFVPYFDDGNGNITVGGTMYFNVDLTERTFTVNTSGFVTDGTKIVDYKGSAQVVEIPNDITAIGENAFNYVNTDVSLISVVIPSSVTEIGARAFQNDYTLRRAVFLSETPISIDFSAANDPFRWGAGDFIIVVPEGSQDAYKAAWSDCKYSIKGSVEVTVLPEFEIENGVLLRYNKQEGSADLLDIVIPDEVTEIADNVFLGAKFLRSIDLKNVTEIGETAFYGCAELVTVKFANVVAIGDGAFGDCVKLRSSGDGEALDLPAIAQIGDSAFYGCVALRRVVVGENIERVGSMAFRECNIFAADPPLFLVLTGNDVPEMGGNIAMGNIAFRIEINDISVALKCFTTNGWNAYCRHLFIPSGDEKGSYMSGADTLELDGRAIYQSSENWLYAIDGEKITFYAYDSETATYTQFDGTIVDGTITVKVHGEGADRTFRKTTGRVKYVTADGKYTLECNAKDLDPESYDGYRGYCDVVFNGNALQMYVNGYNSKTISGFVDADGLMYTASISFDGDTLVVKLVRDERRENIVAADGSVLNIHFDGSLVYVYGEFKIKVGTNNDGTDKYLAFSEVSGVVASVDGDTYSFTFKYLNDIYSITATVSADGNSFAYTYTVK